MKWGEYKQGLKNAFEIRRSATWYIAIKKSHYNHKPKKIYKICTDKKKKSKHNTNDSHQITREENKRRKGEKRPKTANLQ